MHGSQTAQILTPVTLNSGLRVWLDIEWHEQVIASVNFSTRENLVADARLPEKWHELFERYWERPLDRATQHALAALSLDLAGTRYQRRVWSALRQIPSGQTVSYGVISDRLKSSPRAVAAACRANPVVLAVPCHRVISKSGPGGFMGATEGDPIEIKRWLINHEQ